MLAISLPLGLVPKGPRGNPSGAIGTGTGATGGSWPLGASYTHTHTLPEGIVTHLPLGGEIGERSPRGKQGKYRSQLEVQSGNTRGKSSVELSNA